ncbi:MAG: hypothetical protein KAI41_07090, partial [Hyphomicrobiaceae bacterium]|nr:hypothetical protein [Hyphomicrobiaceae bacterium]
MQQRTKTLYSAPNSWVKFRHYRKVRGLPFMDAFEFNKFAAAILLALLVIFGGKTMSNIVFKAHKPEKPGYEIEVADAPDHGADKAADAPQVPFANLLAKASAASGEKGAKKCTSCHTFNQGGADKQGPNLWNIVNRGIGSDS